MGASLPVTSCVVPRTACSAPGITCLAPARVLAVGDADEAATIDVDEPATFLPGDDGVVSSLTRLWLIGGTRGCFVFCRCFAAGLPVAVKMDKNIQKSLLYFVVLHARLCAHCGYC